MSENSVIIIGAGLAGLAAGCYAQMNGYETQIFEHHSAPGGVAATWRRGDYTIEGGIHFLMGHRSGQPVYDMYRELGTAQAGTLVDMTSYGRFVDESSGRSIEVTSDLDRLAGEMKAQSPADSKMIDDLIAGARAFQSAGLGDMGLIKPPELTGPLDRIRAFWRMRPALRYFARKYALPMCEYAELFQDPFLRRLVVSLFMPEVPAWFVFMLLGLLAGGQMGLLEGGSTGFVRPIARRYTDLGGRVIYGATVNEILVEDGRAVGVRLADGSEHRADTIVSAADGYSTIYGMLGGRYVDDKINGMYLNWKLVRPFVMASFGVAREFPGESSVVLVLSRPFLVGDQAVDTLIVRIFNYTDQFAPPGKTVVQVAFESEWAWWNELHRNRPRYEAAKRQVAHEILERLDAHYSRISSQVEVADVATPYTTWRYTLNREGAYEGWLPTPEAIMTPVRRTLPGLANFYMAGQWVVPGGGVPPCLYSGKHVAQLLCRRDRKRFRAITPS